MLRLLLCLTAVRALQQPTLATRRRTGRSDARSTASSSEKQPNLARTASAAALVAGTTVGGGFLGLPAVVKPAGFVPTVVTLTASWLFLLAEALVVAEAVSRCRGQASLSTVAETAGASKFAVRGLFFALVTATLASQLSKAGTLLPAVSYRAATHLFFVFVDRCFLGFRLMIHHLPHHHLSHLLGRDAHFFHLFLHLLHQLLHIFKSLLLTGA